MRLPDIPYLISNQHYIDNINKSSGLLSGPDHIRVSDNIPDGWLLLAGDLGSTANSPSTRLPSLSVLGACVS